MDRLEQLFLSEGFANRTVTKLASDLGCSKRALYEFAPSKTALLVKVVTHNYQRRLAASTATIYAHTHPRDQLFAFLAGIQGRNDQGAEPFLRDVMATPETSRVRQAHITQMLELLESIIRDGMVKGIFRSQNPKLVSTLGFGLMRSIASPDLATRLRCDYPALFDQAVELMLNGVLASQDG